MYAGNIEILSLTAKLNYDVASKLSHNMGLRKFFEKTVYSDEGFIFSFSKI